MLKPFNDVLLVELEDDSGQFISSEESGTQCGTVIEVPDTMTHFSSFGWAFENSFFNEEGLLKVRNVMEELKGKKVYWEEHSDKGMTIEKDGKRYGLVKLSKIICVEV